MAFVMPEIALQRMIQIGLKNLKADREAFDCIFAQFLAPELEASYGQAHIDSIYNWFTGTAVPVLQAWTKMKVKQRLVIFGELVKMQTS
jgi:hypothetical protein